MGTKIQSGYERQSEFLTCNGEDLQVGVNHYDPGEAEESQTMHTSQRVLGGCVTVEDLARIAESRERQDHLSHHTHWFCQTNTNVANNGNMICPVPVQI